MSNFFKEIVNQLLIYSPEQPILYTRPVFWGLFAIIMGLYSFFYKKNSLRNFYLLAISLFLYYKTNGSFLFLLVFSSVLNYIFGLLLRPGRKKVLRKIFLATGIALNLLVLAYFKYAYFFTSSFNQFFHTQFEVVNWLVLWENKLSGSSFDASVILLPVGISFYTFQAISYIADVYKQRVEPVRNIFDFSFYLAFFPQLVAGPIVRASAFIPQLYKKYQLTKAEFGHGLFLILKGLVKKVIFADYIAVNFVDRVFNSPLSYSGVENILAVYGYSLQIYCDFSGYTDIAIGVALLMGFKLPINFNEPYKAISLTNFWRRWHISLSLWLRDYLYIPLGGSRKGNFRTYVNLMITMVLGGLWHGANLQFVIWGAIHGVGLVLDKIWRKITTHQPYKLKWLKYLGIFITFNLVTFAWVFFRAQSWEIVEQFFYQVKYHFDIGILPGIINAYASPFSIALLGYILVWLPFKRKEKIRGWFIKTPTFVKLLITLLVVFLLYQAASSQLQPFIYFRF
ncbi:Probable poly(beta-D-mannuronate) O-acetylase [hydrothermal vent metagenome]|uniref:Probable poly(Beta-D-mannuronate) O-acetylase n=1 Tax=hydrothermal vent metagenome TaxID=652676 RepID=A0A3B0TLT8_9ZZZZ